MKTASIIHAIIEIFTSNENKIYFCEYRTLRNPKYDKEKIIA